MDKRLWIDTETTGLDPEKNGLVQVAIVVEIDGEVKDELSLWIAPFAADELTENALVLIGKTREELSEGVPTFRALNHLRLFMGKYVDKFNSRDKFTACGYNVGFDVDFLHQFFIKGGDPYFYSWMYHQKLDLLPVMVFLKESGLVELEDCKLATVCEHFDIEIEAHDALADVKATKRLYEVLEDNLAI